ncbi:MAG: ribosomal-processing cysteine protease Prp [Erysipelotrichaceae bacterium]
MIHINIHQLENSITKIQVKGHANYAQHGEDLVCAGVSSIMIGLLNALDEYKKDVDMSVNEGFIEILVNDIKDKDLQLMLQVALIQLKTMEESYSNYIGIEKEV